MNNDIFIHPSAVVDDGAVLGAGCRIWHFSHIMGGAELGAGCNIGQNVFIADGVRLGCNVKVQNNVSVYNGVVCEDDVFLGPSCVFTNVVNPRSAFPRRDCYSPTVIRKGATVGANATILCGNEIGKYAFVGAGAVVTAPVLPYSLVVGVPARHVGWISQAGCRLLFDCQGDAVCPESGKKYHKNGETVYECE